MGDRPNVIIILIDTLRADRLSCYGHDRRTTPEIDRIAQSGVVYDYAISAAPWTVPSHASLFTGAYPSRHGVCRSRVILSPELAPLPEVLRRHGYRTYGISNNFWLSRETGFDRGFDEFVAGWQVVQTAGNNVPLQRQQRKRALGLETQAGATVPHGAQPPEGFLHRCGCALNDVFERATKRLRLSFHAYDDGAWRVTHQVRRWAAEWKRSEQPFFAFLHYMEPHLRYSAPGRYRTMFLPPTIDDQRIRRVNQNPWKYLCGKSKMNDEDFTILQGLYDGEINYADSRIGQVYDFLRDQGLLKNTLLIITSDHGENVGDHQFMDHAYCLYDTLVRVPLIISGPEFPQGTRVADQVQTVDLFPTILSLVGIEDEVARQQVQGRSIQPVPRDRVAITEYLEPQPTLDVLRDRFPGFDGTRYDRMLRSVRTLDYKYIWASDGNDELYDMRNDPKEERNVIANEPARAAQLRAQLDQWLESFRPAAGPAEDFELDALTRRRLEDLGYL